MVTLVLMARNSRMIRSHAMCAVQTARKNRISTMTRWTSGAPDASTSMPSPHSSGRMPHPCELPVLGELAARWLVGVRVGTAAAQADAARACARAPWEQPPVAILITICTETMIPYSLCPCSVCPPSHRSSCYVEFSCRLRSALGSCWGITAVLPLYEPQTVLLTAVNASPPQEPATEQ